MPTDFPFVEVPEHLLPIIGERDGGTRIYRKRGPSEASETWHELIYRIAGPTVSPGGVLMYCPVSRAAVYKRMKEGKLTAFNFYPMGPKTRFFGGLVKFREMPYCYIPVSEAKAWRTELEERALAQGKVTKKELEEARRAGEWAEKILEHGKLTPEDLQGLKPDVDGFFLEWDSRWAREQKRKAKEAKP